MADLVNNVLALGFFDAIHCGHKYLFDEGKKIANELNTDLCVVTFDDNFYSLLGRNSDEIFLLEERKKILKEYGINKVLVLPTNKEFLEKDKMQFLDFLMQFSPKGIIVGSDYRFGKNAEGSIDDIFEFFNKNTIVKKCNLLEKFNKKISTCDIKNYLKNGEIKTANILLGNRFFYYGKVVHGKENGRKMGVPTLNLKIPYNKIKIKEGVYATLTEIEGKSYKSITNVGTHPTFDNADFNVETYVIEGNFNFLYDKTVRIYFLDRVRDVIRFNSPEDLASQINKDIEFARSIYD